MSGAAVAMMLGTLDRALAFAALDFERTIARPVDEEVHVLEAEVDRQSQVLDECLELGRPDSVDEAVHFAGKLAESQMSVTGLIVNRVQPRFAEDAELDALADAASVSPDSPLGQLVENLRGYTAASDREERAYADLVAKVAPAPVYRIPLLNSDVHDLDGLATVAGLLFMEPGGPDHVPAGPQSESHPGR